MAEQLGRLAQRYVSERTRRGEIRKESSRTLHYTLVGFVQVVGWERSPNRLRQVHIERWMQRAPLSDGTRRSQLSIVRCFCNWLVRNGHARSNPTINITSPRQPRRLPRGIRHSSVADTLAECPDVRAVLIISLEVQEGLRACEVCNLQLGDLDLDEGLMMVRGKGGHERVLPITDETRTAMARYLAEHPATAGPLVRSYNHPNRGVTAKYLSRMVSGWMHAAGVDSTGHALRHTMATDSLRNGAHIRDVQQALGHQSLATTQLYLPWLVGDLKTAMGGRSYRRPVQPTLFDVNRPA